MKDETRRLRAVVKILNGYEEIDRNMFFKFKEGHRTREPNNMIVESGTVQVGQRMHTLLLQKTR